MLPLEDAAHEAAPAAQEVTTLATHQRESLRTTASKLAPAAHVAAPVAPRSTPRTATPTTVVKSTPTTVARIVPPPVQELTSGTTQATQQIEHAAGPVTQQVEHATAPVTRQLTKATAPVTAPVVDTATEIADRLPTPAGALGSVTDDLGRAVQTVAPLLPSAARGLLTGTVRTLGNLATPPVTGITQSVPTPGPLIGQPVSTQPVPTHPLPTQTQTASPVAPNRSVPFGGTLRADWHRAHRTAQPSSTALGSTGLGTTATLASAPAPQRVTGGAAGSAAPALSAAWTPLATPLGSGSPSAAGTGSGGGGSAPVAALLFLLSMAAVFAGRRLIADAAAMPLAPFVFGSERPG
jgi:hypothetical protein